MRDILYVKQRLLDTLSMTVQIRVEISVPCLIVRFAISVQRFFFFSNEHMFVCYVMYSLYVVLSDIIQHFTYILILRDLHVCWTTN